MRFGLVFAMSVLAACIPGEDQPDRDPDAEKACGAEGLQHLVGEQVDAQAFGSDDRPLRILPPGSAMTMDHRPERLNVDVDAKGAITRIWCG